MQPKRKSNSVVTTSRLESGALAFDVLGAGRVTFDPTKAHPDMRAYAEIHGWGQRIVDAAALGRDDETGKPASPAEKMARMQRVVDHYESGTDQWRLDARAGGGQSIVVLAYQRHGNIATYDMAKAAIERRAVARGETYDAYLRIVAAIPAIQDAIIAIQRERLPEARLDADEELAALNG